MVPEPVRGVKQVDFIGVMVGTTDRVTEGNKRRILNKEKLY